MYAGVLQFYKHIVQNLTHINIFSECHKKPRVLLFFLLSIFICVCMPQDNKKKNIGENNFCCIRFCKLHWIIWSLWWICAISRTIRNQFLPPPLNGFQQQQLQQKCINLRFSEFSSVFSPLHSKSLNYSVAVRCILKLASFLLVCVFIFFTDSQLGP